MDAMAMPDRQTTAAAVTFKSKKLFFSDPTHLKAGQTHVHVQHICIALLR